MNIKELRVLTLLVQHGTVSHVAGVLGMTQPGVSRLIKSLENRVKRPLFYRHNNKLIPTKYALEMADNAVSVLADVDSFSHTFLHDNPTNKGHVHIIAPSVFNKLLSRIVTRIHHDQSPVPINLSIAPSEQVIQKMATQNFDLGVIAHNTPIAGDLRLTRLCKSPVRCMMHKDSPLAGHNTITPQMLALEHVIYPFHRDSQQSRLVQQVFKGIHMDNMPFYAVDTHMACDLVANNMGIALMADPIAQMVACENDNIVVIPFAEQVFQRLHWVTPTHGVASTAVSQIMTTATEIITEYSPDSILS